jgi:hypothetical protein
MRFRAAAAIVTLILVVTSTARTMSATAQTTQTSGDPRLVALVNGDSAARRDALDAINLDPKVPISAALRDAFKAAATDPDPRVTRDVARLLSDRMLNGGAKPVDAGAIDLACELATHADHTTRFNAVFYGLSNLRPQTDQTIAAMLAAGATYVEYDSDLHGSIATALRRTPPAKIAAACERYWTSEYAAAKPQSAWVIYQTYKAATGKEPPRPERFPPIKASVDALIAQRKADHARMMPELARELSEGDAKRRQAVIDKIYDTPYLLFDLDDSLIDAFTTAADDADARVRGNVVRMVGQRWIWGEERQPPKAIALALKLRTDPDSRVRHFAIYFGLSTVNDPSDEVIRAQLESAIVTNDPESFYRVAWGLRQVPPDRLASFFGPYFDRGGEQAKRASELFGEITQTSPRKIVVTPATTTAASTQRS